MKVTLFDYTEDAERKIATAAAECYDSSLAEEALERRVKHLIKMKHLATLRFAYATFHVEGVSRVCTHQMVRHAHLSYLQRSQRYCNEAEAEVVYPPSLDDAGKAIFDMGIAHTRTIYNSLVERGVPKGDARFILPQAVESSMYITGNLHAWLNFLTNRLDKAAQFEIRKVAEAIHIELLRIAPNIFGHLENLSLQNGPGEAIDTPLVS